MLFFHGTGTTPDEMRIKVEVVGQGDEDYSRADGWSPRIVELRPETIPALTARFGGTLISTACGSGREPFARAFLQGGCSAYIGPAEEYYDASASLAFTTAPIYHALAADRDFETLRYTDREATIRAAGLDPEFKFGTRSFRYYDQTDMVSGKSAPDVVRVL